MTSAWPDRYGDGPAEEAVAREYGAAREGCGLTDLPDRAVLVVTGPTRLKFVHNLVSNDLASLQPGQGRLASLMDVKGRLLVTLRALATELRKLGVTVSEFSDGLQIDGNPEALHGTEIATYDDHRMAMCFGMAGARLPGIRIQEPACVAKTYPEFWEDLRRVGVQVQQV